MSTAKLLLALNPTPSATVTFHVAARFLLCPCATLNTFQHLQSEACGHFNLQITKHAYRKCKELAFTTAKSVRTWTREADVCELFWHKAKLHIIALIVWCNNPQFIKEGSRIYVVLSTNGTQIFLGMKGRPISLILISNTIQFFEPLECDNMTTYVMH